MRISILTLFPEMFAGPFAHSILKRAQKQKLIEIEFVNIRDFGIGKHKLVDDTPYGGGAGMIMRVDVIDRTISNIKNKQSLSLRDQKSKIEETTGVCERCETTVEKRELEQWFFRITSYADRLLNNLEKLD
ncbi:MAG: hypothetical protein HYY87_01500, partial [Candidatus Levybacteria bacterium]|nr:hypothetical protein [Candidatus Levybacteria bacterium]